MALTAPSNKLAAQVISASFDQILYLDNAAGLVEATLKIVSTETGKSAVQLDDERLLVKGVDTSNAAAFDVQNTGGTSVFKVNASTAGTTTIGTLTVGVDGTGHDVKFFGDSSGKYLLWDQSADELALIGDGTKLSFYDAAGGENISADGSGVLSISGGAEIDLTSVIIDVNATTTCTIDNTNTSNGVVINAATSGGPISIGHATSETTVNDNLTVTGTSALNDHATVAVNKQLKFGDGAQHIATDNTDLTITTDIDLILSALKVGIGTSSPANTLHVSHAAADADNGIMIVNEQTTITDGELLGGIGFDGADGNVPSSVLEASCFIAAYAAEDHGTGDKGGDLTFGCSKINENDDVVSTTYLTLGSDGSLFLRESSAVHSYLDSYSTVDTACANLYFRKSGNSTLDSHTIVADGEALGVIQFSGSDGTNFEQAALIECFVDGTPSDGTDMPGRLVFSTSPDGDDDAVERMRINSSGVITSSFATGTAAGGGIDAVSPTISVGNYNSEIVTTVFIDIGAGLILSSGSTGEVIGEDGVANAYVTRITTAINGLVYRGEVICLEVPTTGDPDVNVSANSSGTIAEDASGEGQHVLANCGVHTLGLKTDFTIPGGGIQDDYIYLTHGGTTAGTYDAGKFLIRFYGASVTSL